MSTLVFYIHARRVKSRKCKPVYLWQTGRTNKVNNDGVSLKKERWLKIEEMINVLLAERHRFHVGRG